MTTRDGFDGNGNDRDYMEFEATEYADFVQHRKELFGLRIAELRIKNKMKWKDVAREVGKMVDTVKNWELGIHAPNYAEVRVLASVFKVSERWLYDPLFEINENKTERPWKEKLKEARVNLKNSKKEYRKRILEEHLRDIEKEDGFYH